VESLLESSGSGSGAVLDPFCGTGTTALSCAERGIRCATTDINPFLVWFARAKTRAYSEEELGRFRAAAEEIAQMMATPSLESAWVPPLHRVEKWWSEQALRSLGEACELICRRADRDDPRVLDLLRITFCRTLIAHARVSFGHQSMSFRRRTEDDRERASSPERELVRETFARNAAVIATSAGSSVRVEPDVLECDARVLERALPAERFRLVITSPPYPNRMSYIRELRPYMYWLRYLDHGRAAGELDWQAIGGTWGAATSNVGKWRPPDEVTIPHPGFDALTTQIGARSPLLSRYVQKYFYDMWQHCRSLFDVVERGGRIHYIVGNSKFYDTLVPVERIFASLFLASGFVDTEVRAIRKRTSKKELFEYVVSARKPD
jgi:hypothetical protein